MNLNYINETLGKLTNTLLEKGGAVTYKYHSTQIDLSDCASEKDHFFYSTKKLIPDASVYRELPQVAGPLGDMQDDESEEYGLETTPHVTVLYGLTREMDYFKLRNKLKSFGPIDFEIGNISSFRTEAPFDVLKMEIISKKLEKLHYWMRKNFPNNNKYPEYKPHLTLGYIQKGSCKDLEGACDWTGKQYTAPLMHFSHADSFKLPVKFA